MKPNHLYLLLLFTSISLISKAQEIGCPIIHNYTPKDYNGTSQVWSAVQDSRGVMYFGISGAILEYDGISWRTIPVNKEAIAYDLAIDKNGKIYVAGMGEFGYLKPDKKGNTQYKTLTHHLPDTTYKTEIVWSVKITTKFVYFLTYDAILQYSPNNEELSILKADTNSRFFGDFIYNDIYYVRQSNKGLMKIENNKFKYAFQSEFFNNKHSFRTVTPFSDKTLLIPTRTESLYIYHPDKDTIPKVFAISNNDFFVDNNIYSSSLFQKKHFVIGSLNKGALLFNKQGRVLQQYNENKLLQNNTILEIITDTSQNIWLGLDNGLSKTEHSQDLSYWDKNTGLKGSVNDVIRFNGKLYIASSGKVYFIDKNNQVRELRNIPVGQNWSFLRNEKNKYMLCGTSQGIYEIKGDNAALIYKGSHAFFLYQSIKNPFRTFSTDYADLISIRFENDRWVSEGKWEGVKDQIRGIIEDEKGEIWLGTKSNGVIRITPDYENITKPKKVKYYNEKDGFKCLIDILPFKYKNKIIWGTEKGLYSYNSQTDRFEPFCELGEAFCNDNHSIFSLIEMADGKIWISPSTNNKSEIVFLHPNNKGGYDWVYEPFRRIPDMEILAFHVEPSGVAWIGGSEGLYRYEMSKDTKNYTQKFNCLIRKITVGTDSLIYGGGGPVKNPVELEYKFNTIKFEFAAPFFDQEEKTLYSYQLEGYDRTWSNWSREIKKEYTNLNKGNYNMKVKALNVYGIESEIDTFQVILLPPFYRTWWAYAIYLFILILTVWMIVKLNSYRLRKEKQQLETIVKERTNDIVQKNEELEQQKEEILTQAEQLQDAYDKLQKVDQFKKGMTSMIVHDLKNPLNLIINASKSGNKDNQISIMQQSGKQMLNMVLNILDLDKYENMKMALDIKDKRFILITKNAIKQIQFLSEQKNILIKNKIDQNLVTKVDDEITERILVNLLTNALKYTPLNGSITLSSKPTSENFAQIAVTDTGEGIPKEKMQLVFQKFGQIIAKKSSGVRSTGLGLTFCKLAVEAHGGEIGVISEIGKGTTFWFTLQLSQKKHVTLKSVEKEEEIEQEIIIFTEAERNILEPIINRLNEFSVYETGDIEEIVAELKQNESENIQKWIKLIYASLVSLNESKYLELLEIK